MCVLRRRHKTATPIPKQAKGQHAAGPVATAARNAGARVPAPAPSTPTGLPLEVGVQNAQGSRGGLRTSICVDAPAPRERRKRSAAAEAAWAALAAAGPTGWAPPWPASSEQQLPIAGGALPPRQPPAGEISNIGGVGSAWGRELPQAASEQRASGVVETTRRLGSARREPERERVRVEMGRGRARGTGGIYGFRSV